MEKELLNQLTEIDDLLRHIYPKCTQNQLREYVLDAHMKMCQAIGYASVL